MMRRSVVAALAASLLALAACSKPDAPAIASDAGVRVAPQVASPPAVPAAEWQLLASELPSALLSVTGRSASDIYAVGADKGPGPYILHFDGSRWTSLGAASGLHADLWWSQAIAGGPVLMAGSKATVLRYDGQHFERLKTPGPDARTVYGVWGASGDDFYAVGNANGKNGFVWHFTKGTFVQETLPKNLPRTATGDAPGFFKVGGNGDDVWVVGAAGAILHRKGAAAFVTVPSGTKDTLFTVSGYGDRVVAVGGSGNGVLLVSENAGGGFHDASPPGAGLLQGISVGANGGGDWASGERGLVYNRTNEAPSFALVDHGIPLPAASSLHAIFADASGGVWSVGGNVLTPALDGGMMIHYGKPVPVVTLDE